MTKQRLIWADSLKGWLMLLVILGHAVQNTLGPDCCDSHLWNIIYSFHMPLFFFFAGYCFKEEYLFRGRLSENFETATL